MLVQEKNHEAEKEKTIDEVCIELHLIKEDDKRGGGDAYRKLIGEIARWASEQTDEKRLRLYPTWTDENFQTVLDRMDEDLLSGE